MSGFLVGGEARSATHATDRFFRRRPLSRNTQVGLMIASKSCAFWVRSYSGRFGPFLGIGRTRRLTQGSGLESSGAFPLTLYPARLTVISATRTALSVRSVFVEGTIATPEVGIVTPNGAFRTLSLAVQKGQLLNPVKASRRLKVTTWNSPATDTSPGVLSPP